MAVTPPKPPSLPAACTECVSTVQLAAPGSQPSQIPYKMARSASGQMRIDYATTSIITNPATGVTTMLDHTKQEFRAIPASAGAQMPQMMPPGMPGAPGAMPPPGSPAMVVKDLGVRMVQGIEVHGQQITMPPMAPPAAPAAPAVPAAPQVPGMAVAAAVPKPGQVPMIAETWVSTKLQMPVLSRITGSFGQQMCQCKNTVAGEPPASAFQIPPGYKQVGLPQPPAAPAMPAMPAAPKMPSMPGAPAMPAMPAAPKMPAAPAAPPIPSTPKPPFKF